MEILHRTAFPELHRDFELNLSLLRKTLFYQIIKGIHGQVPHHFDRISYGRNLRFQKLRVIIVSPPDDTEIIRNTYLFPPAGSYSPLKTFRLTMGIQ